LRPDHIQRFYVAKLDSGVGVSTVRLCHAVLHRPLTHAVKWGLLARNVCDAVDKPRPIPRRCLSGTPIRWAVLAGDSGASLGALFHLAVTTGLRQGELLGLLWTDLNWTTGSSQFNVKPTRRVARFEECIKSSGGCIGRDKHWTSCASVRPIRSWNVHGAVERTWPDLHYRQTPIDPLHYAGYSMT